MIILPPIVEALEAVWRKSDGGRSRKIELTAVKQVKECVLQDFRPDLEILEVCLST